MKIPDRLLWLFQRRRQLIKKLPGFYAHWNSYADPACVFSAENKLQSGAFLVDVQLGAFSYVAFGAQIKHSSIGKFCSIGPETLVGGLGKHPTRYLSTHPAFYSRKRGASAQTFHLTDFDEQPPTRVGHDVWIGARAIVLDGAHIGNGAIIAANALVSGEVEPYTLVAGVPARPIRKRFSEEIIQMLEDWAWWNLPTALLQSVAAEFCQENWTSDKIRALMAQTSAPKA